MILSVLMILMSDVSLQSIIFMEKPVTSNDFKWFDDFDVECQFAIDILLGKTRIVSLQLIFCMVKPVTSKDFKRFDDFDF